MEQEKREQQNIAAKKWRDNNPDKSKESCLAWRENNRDYERDRVNQWRIDNPEKQWFSNLKSKYGITREEYESKLAEQLYVCGSCGDDVKLHVDHDHLKKKGEVGYFRGLICRPCNNSIGAVNDSIDKLEKAIDYLKRCGRTSNCDGERHKGIS